MLRLDKLTLTVGRHELIVDSSLHIHPGERVGLVGRNGVGKSSLFRLLMGEFEAESGRFHLRAGARMGYLPQEAVGASSRTVWDEASLGLTELRAMQTRLDALQERMDAGDDRAIEQHAELSERFRLAGGFSSDERVGEVLDGLGFRPDAWHKPCSEFSGGWRMRIALAKVLLSAPDLLLLDEPTNHLDLLARSWLAGFLRKWPGTVIVISHDRHLLDTATDRTVELVHKRLISFKGNFSQWLAEKALRDAQQLSAYEAQQKVIARLERFVERFGAKATKAAQAKSKQKVLDKLDRVDAPTVESIPYLRLPEAPGCAMDAIELQKVSVGWTDPLATNLDLLIRRGERVAVLGANGSGKSTLLKAILGGETLLAGRRRIAHGVRIGVYRQDLALELPESERAVDWLLGMVPSVTPTRARAALGSLGLVGDLALRQIGDLSGGQRARVVLARFALEPYNVLLLDEPTNHLDAVTVETLVEALREFEGAVVFVTHDRYLVEQLATHVVRFHEGVVDVHPGVLETDLEPPRLADKRVQKDKSGGLTHEERKKRRRERTRMERRVEKLGAEMEAAEEQAAELEDAMFEAATDPAKMRELDTKLRAARSKVEELYAEWEELEAKLEELSDD